MVALPPVDLVISGQIKATDIPPTNEKVDIWALGVTIYELVTGGCAWRGGRWVGSVLPLICPAARYTPELLFPAPQPPCPPAGRLPFEGKDKPEIKRNITANNLAAMPGFLTPQCQDFIRAMLTYSPHERPSCAQLLKHPYITMHCAPPPPQQQQPKPAAVAAAAATGGLPNIIALHAYSPGAGGWSSGCGVVWWSKVGGCLWYGLLKTAACPCPAPAQGPIRKLHACAVPGVAVLAAGGADTGDGGPSGGSGESSGGGAASRAASSASFAPITPGSSGQISYRDALAGGSRAPAVAADNTRTPRTPGGSHVPVTVSRNAAATGGTGQHSPTILAQPGCTPRQDPFTSPLRPADSAAAGGAAAPRKISFDFFATTQSKAPAGGALADAAAAKVSIAEG